ncbi:acyl-CoA oxidase [Rhizodiscina lignyota]|uniref:Acyl-coenzyme A oxidase n=1 Tax=Rhizodiscina lignyota TaxID=1504668 RepID=A0A9P4M3B2_9PEZI|nr:acyl-CoA oxidase [Rhizodiscina lignyota]
MEKRNISNEVHETPLSTFLWGGKDRIQRRKQVVKALTSNPIFSNYPPPGSLARKESWTKAVHQAKELIAISFREKWTHEQFRDAVRMFDGMLPVQPQYRIFLSNLERQASDEQKAEWVPKAEHFEIFGSYSQTELGHGSNVKAIETTATFDKETDEFVINTPSVSATKYWIGTTGIWATHSLIVAKLIIDGKNYGNHLFFTQLRDLNTQKLMPGVEIYELGPKAFQSMVGVDNGAMQFHNVRVPRSQMLSRNAQVKRDGTYVPPKNVKHSYGSMITVRAIMAEITGYDLLKAVAVAFHYTTFRKQFQQKGKSEETTVFDYASVRYRLLPLLAQGTALVIVGQHVKRKFDQYTEAMVKTGDISGLEDIHLQTVGAKVYATHIAAHGIEVCRVACGGHGFNALSGFGRMYANSTKDLTVEGDNYVISQQVPRAILKHYDAKSENSVPSLSYLSLLREAQPKQKLSVRSKSDWFALENQQWVMERRLAHLVEQHIRATKAGKDTSFSVHELTMAHSDYTYWRGLWEVIPSVDSSIAEPLKAIGQVFSLHILQHAHKDLFGEYALSAAQRDSLADAYDDAVQDLAKYARDVIDGYGFTEWEMDSALAKAKDTPYEALFKGAQASEMNHLQHLWPFIISVRNVWKEVQAEKARL